MRKGFLSAVIAALVFGVAAFFGGEYWAKHETERELASVLSLQAASQHAEALFISRRALVNLRGGKVADADVLLVRYAKLQAAALADCSKSQQCAAWVGKFMPTQAELSELAAMREGQ